MAVVKQKLATVSGSKESLETAVLRCASAEEFYPEEPPGSVGTFRRYIAPGETNPYITLKAKAKSLLEEINSLFLPSELTKSSCAVPVFSSSEQYADYLREMEQKLSDFESDTKNLQKKLEENKILKEQLSHLQSINTPLRELYEFEYIKIRFGYLPRENYDRFEVYIGSIQSAIFLPSSIEKEFVWGMYLTLRDSSAENDKVFATLGFKRVRLPSKADSLPSESIHELEVEIAQQTKMYEEAKKKFHDYAADVYKELSECGDYLSVLARAFEIKKKVLIISDKSFTFYGWANNHLFDELRNDLKGAGVEISVQSFEADDVNEPPVVLKNLRIFRPFQQFVEMYGLPSYNEIDPTPFVAITYSIFFGMMFGDVGQGAVLVLAGLAAKKFMKLKFGSILSIIGLFSIGFGFFYGSIFGDEEIIHGFKPMENVNTILLSAVAIGALMITICSILNIINGIRQKNYEKFLFSPNGIAGIIFYWSVLILAIDMLGIGNLGLPSNVLKIAIAVSLIMMFAREPLSKLIAGRKDWKPEKAGEAAVENFFELFEIILSYITNTISFIRIGAFALSHASMMAVVFMIANQQSGAVRIAIIIGGNLLVMALEGLVVSIQVLRLEFYELFSRFYEGEGHEVKDYTR